MELFKHQKTGIEFLKTKEKAILADEMGMGKTRQAIVAAKESCPEMAVIVICPASLKINWQREIKAVYPEDETYILNTTDGLDYEDIRHLARWYIVNYDILEKKLDILEPLASNDADTLILDEAHYIKGKTIRSSVVVGGKVKKKSGTVMKFSGLANLVNNVYCLTGTPLLNRPIELFNLLTAIGHPLGGHGKRSMFARTFCGAFLRTIYVKGGYPIRILDESGSSNLDELREQLKGWILRRKKTDAIDLPKKIVSVMATEMTKEWKTAYKNAWEDYLAFLAENPLPEEKLDNILMTRHLIEIGKLKQVCSQAKVARIAEDIRNAAEQGEKVIVFSQYTNTIKLLEQALKGKDPIKSVTLTGTHTMEERQKSVDAFQNDPEVKAFISNIKAGGVGLTLTKGSIVMFADMDWSPETHRQAEDRAHRIGQTQMVNVYYYVTEDTIEEDIVRILNEKKNVMDQILEGGKKRLAKNGMQEAFLKLMKKKLDSQL